MTARFGDRTRVETTVAMELAESWNPFRKSKTSARSHEADDGERHGLRLLQDD